MRFDPNTKLIYVGYGEGALAIIDSMKMIQTGGIKLAAHPESFQLERQAKRAFVNVPDAKHIAVIDLEKKTVTATWPMTQFQANFPMALDEAGCHRPARPRPLSVARSDYHACRSADFLLRGRPR